MNTPSDLTVKVLYTKNELRRAIYSDSFRKPLFWATSLIPAAIISYELRTFSFWWIVAIAIAGALLLFAPLLRARTILKSEALSSPIVLSFSNAGVSAEYVNGTNAADWSLVTGARESPHFVFLGMQRGSFHLIPKTQITSDQATKLRAILRSHVQKHVSLFNSE